MYQGILFLYFYLNEINRKPLIKWELIHLLQLIFYFVPFNSVSDKPHFLPIAQCERVTGGSGTSARFMALSSEKTIMVP